jgi:hypothetical protein
MFLPVLSNMGRDAATELKTDSWHRYMLYRQDERFLPFASKDERRAAVEKGRDWHERVAKSGSDIEVVSTTRLFSGYRVKRSVR